MGPLFLLLLESLSLYVWSEPDVRVSVTGGGVNVNVQGTFQLGDRSQVNASVAAARWSPPVLPH